jgi:hypothetical protein
MIKDENEDIELKIRVRVLRDEAFRKALLSSPKETLEREYNVTIPSGWKIHVHEETEGVIHFVVPGRLPGGQQLSTVLDETITSMMSQNRTDCCTCGSSTSQTFSSIQHGCGC